MNAKKKPWKVVKRTSTGIRELQQGKELNIQKQVASV
jgi:hypothetical protein